MEKSTRDTAMAMEKLRRDGNNAASKSTSDVRINAVRDAINS